MATVFFNKKTNYGFYYLEADVSNVLMYFTEKLDKRSAIVSIKLLCLVLGKKFTTYKLCIRVSLSANNFIRNNKCACFAETFKGNRRLKWFP